MHASAIRRRHSAPVSSPPADSVAGEEALHRLAALGLRQQRQGVYGVAREAGDAASGHDLLRVAQAAEHGQDRQSVSAVLDLGQQARPTLSPGVAGHVLRLVHEQHDGTGAVLGASSFPDRCPRGASGLHRVDERRHRSRAGDAQPGNPRNPAPSLGGRRLRHVDRGVGDEGGQDRLGKRDRRGQLPRLAVDRHRRVCVAVRRPCAPASGKLVEQRGLARPRGAEDQPGAAPDRVAARRGLGHGVLDVRDDVLPSDEGGRGQPIVLQGECPQAGDVRAGWCTAVARALHGVIVWRATGPRNARAGSGGVFPDHGSRAVR